MSYRDRTKEQLMNESAELRQRIEDLEADATKRKKTEFVRHVSLVDHERSIFIWDNNK